MQRAEFSAATGADFLPGIWVIAAIACALVLGARPATAQMLQANDDSFGIPYGQQLVVEAFGVLENDILNDESAGENGATAELVTDAARGTLMLASDGSFSYSPGPMFRGTDEFVYRAVFGSVVSEATVTLTACNGGPQIFTCWQKPAFLAMASANGFPRFEEGFESDAVWGDARSPATILNVTDRGLTWRANDFDPTHVVPPFPPSPPPNHITTGPGPARTGMWGLFDLAHGYAVGSTGQCDVGTPPAHCFYHDGMTVARAAGSGPLHGAGGYFTASSTADVAIVVNGDWENPIGGGGISHAHQFFGVIDTGPTGFDEIQFREVDGRVSDAFFIFADDFTLLATPPDPPPDAIVPGLGTAGILVVTALLSLSAVRVLRSRSARRLTETS